MCGFKVCYCQKAIWCFMGWMILTVDRYRNGNKYLDVLELNILNKRCAAAERSYGNFSLHSSGSWNVDVDKKGFIHSRNIVEHWKLNALLYQKIISSNCGGSFHREHNNKVDQSMDIIQKLSVYLRFYPRVLPAFKQILIILSKSLNSLSYLFIRFSFY